MRLSGTLAALLLVSSAGSACSQQAPVTRGEGETGECTIERVIDGDTVVCAEGAVRVRLLLIDAPEMGQGEFGARSRAALASILPLGARIRLERDVQERDQYGRVLAYLHTEDGRMANEEMLRLGFAVVAVYPPNVRHVDRFRAVAEEARRMGRGLWSGSAFECAPSDFRGGRCR